MNLSDIGMVAHKCWMDIPAHFPFVELGAFVVMPNHVHGIIIIDNPDNTIIAKPDDEQIIGNDNNRMVRLDSVETPKLGVSTGTTEQTDATTTDGKKQTTAASEKWKSGTLGVIVNQYKRACTLQAKKIRANFQWQTRYHDHIIRNREEYLRISEYIVNNPTKWDEDKFYRE